MNVGTYIHAKLFNSTTAATKLATQDPQKYSEFAAQLIAVKNTNNEKALAKASAAFEAVMMSPSDLAKVSDICHDSVGSSAGAVKGAARLLEAYTNHRNALNESFRLTKKEVKYQLLATNILSAMEVHLRAEESKAGA